VCAGEASAANARKTQDRRNPHLRGFFDAGGGTRTPDTRIMIGALTLVFPAFEAGFVGFVGVRRGQIYRVGDMVRDTALGVAGGELPPSWAC
jgi:hypothetical protein